jgi:hypothetical protein
MLARAAAGLALCLAAALSVGADVAKLPREHGPLKLAMTIKEFKRATGLANFDACADCGPEQSVAELDMPYFAKALEWFPALARKQVTQEAAPTVFFYKGRLEFVLFTLLDYDYNGVRTELERVLGKNYKREIFQKTCIYAAGETYTWTDTATAISLTEYRDPSGTQLELKLADRQLLADAEKLQDAAQREAMQHIEKESNCP